MKVNLVKVNLRALRLNRGLSLVEAGEKMGVPHYTLDRVERGQSTPRPATALKIASFYGYRVTDIWPVERAPAA